ncbi:MAG: tetratricopeptide repeat protein [Verrucomicrobiota bacterium]
MTRILGALCFLLTLTVSVALAATPQDKYLQIYLLIQEADKLETAGQKASARERYSVALQRLRGLHEENPDWEPTIVKYRIKYTEEKVAALEGGEDANPDQIVPPIPADLITESQNVNYMSSEPSSAASGGPVGTGSGATSQLTDMESSEQGISPSMSIANPETLDTATSAAPSDPYASITDPQLLRNKIYELEGELKQTRERLNGAIADAAQLRTRVAQLEQDLQVARQGTNNDQVQALMAENEALKQQLEQAQSSVSMMQGGGLNTVNNLQEQINKLQGQLELARKENEALQQTTSEYKKQLEDSKMELEKAGNTIAELNKPNPLMQENRILREVIERTLKDQARRELAGRMAMEELNALGIDATKLKTQVDILASPTLVLTDEEKALLKKPKAAVLMGDTSDMDEARTVADKMDYSSRPRVPEEFRDDVEKASRLFAEQRFDEAAAIYQMMLNEYPDSLYALSNLGVTRFQQQKYAEAEIALKRAVELAPQDAFSHSILGIVLYQQAKYDEAVQVLTRAVALEPNDPKSHNYLGIAASQKGWQEAAEQECRKAIELDDKYGDAHFNLAVIYATQRPPSRELSRRHYQRALELGVPRDDELEKLLQ